MGDSKKAAECHLPAMEWLWHPGTHGSSRVPGTGPTQVESAQQSALGGEVAHRVLPLTAELSALNRLRHRGGRRVGTDSISFDTI